MGWGGHLHLVSSSYPGAEEGRHIKGQEAGAWLGGQEGELRRNQGKAEAGGTGHALNTSCENEASSTFLGDEAAARQVYGVLAQRMEGQVLEGWRTRQRCL